jgi:hypothetical protein
MRHFYHASISLSILLISAFMDVAQAGHVAVDSNIHFAVFDGTAWVDIAPPAGAAATSGTYVIPERSSANPVPIGGGNTVTVVKFNASENIRVEWDDSLELLWLKNAKISSANAITNLRFRIWRNFTTAGNEVGNMFYKEQGGGWLKRANGLPAANAQIVMRGFIEPQPPNPPNNGINNLTLPPVSCTPRPDLLVRCATPVWSLISWDDSVTDTTPHSLVAPSHMVTMEFWLSLPHGGGPANKDFLQLASGTTGGIKITGSSAPGGGGTSDCDHCQGADCATCPNCDGQGIQPPPCPEGKRCMGPDECPTCPPLPWWCLILLLIIIVLLFLRWRRI